MILKIVVCTLVSCDFKSNLYCYVYREQCINKNEIALAIFTPSLHIEVIFLISKLDYLKFNKQICKNFNNFT